MFSECKCYREPRLSSKLLVCSLALPLTSAISIYDSNARFLQMPPASSPSRSPASPTLAHHPTAMTLLADSPPMPLRDSRGNPLGFRISHALGILISHPSLGLAGSAPDTTPLPMHRYSIVP